MFHRMSVELDLSDASRMDNGMKLLFYRFQQDQDSGYLNSAAGGTGRRTHNHQHYQQTAGKLRPGIEVHRGETGGGHHRGHLKRRLVDAIAKEAQMSNGAFYSYFFKKYGMKPSDYRENGSNIQILWTQHTLWRHLFAPGLWRSMKSYQLFQAGG